MLVRIQNFLKDKIHPFDKVPKETNYEGLMANYLAMSQAFPYLQAGCQKSLIDHHINNNLDVPEAIELTTVVGNFLCWDETGGMAGGSTDKQRLSDILNTGDRFHSNLLRNDCQVILGRAIVPDYSSVTKQYLDSIHDGFASLCDITRLAMMVSFESHANEMISALWRSLSARFSVDPDGLGYFCEHVGGDDPAEAYHVEMTQCLINRVIPAESNEDFFVAFCKAYSVHENWCQSIINISCKQGGELYDERDSELA
ncbi:MAG: hypothetical protein CMF50_01255 [Legionellales bacterium]|nr:hypothetical protein [Legionellales bacterium]|tara:strand:+ start:1808 stop:2575 length:768 start_codon:yes stop_codon:yes gene_type:complete